MNLARFNKVKYIVNESPIEFLKNLTESIGGPNIYIKRDDKLDLSVGGNKVRKLEFLMADALKNEADTIITCGAVQSNHCCLTLSAANKENMKCYLVLEERVAGSYNKNANGNNFLYKLLGVNGIRVVKGGSDMMAEMEKLANELKSEGKKPYIIPGGGSNSIGALGYLSCAQEIMKQTYDQGLVIDKIVVASGSGGTHSGLLAGLKIMNANIPVIGIGVNKRKFDQTNLIFNKTKEIFNMMGTDQLVSIDDVIVYDDYIGDGYSLPTDSMVEAVQMLAKKEAILIDPVYTGKAMAGLIDLARKGILTKDENVLFVHTGGSTAMFAYQDILLNKLNSDLEI